MKQRTIARILRVNHGGEHGAIRIYRAQRFLARLRCPDLIAFLDETLGHEEEHVTRFRALMPTRSSRPCRLMWLWGIGGSVLGGVTALLGRKAVFICTEAVERTVHRHLDDQLRYIGEDDPELAGTIREIQAQELGHLQYALAGRGEATAVGRHLDSAIVTVTEALIWLSTQGDSARLARDLSAARG